MSVKRQKPEKRKLGKRKRFNCWRCGRFARVIKFVPYCDMPGGTIFWHCKACGDQSDGT